MRTLLFTSLLLTLVACGDDTKEPADGGGDDGADSGEDTDTPDEDDEDPGDDTGDAGDDTGEPEPVDADGDGVFSDEDCDDDNDAAYPGAPEYADGLDTDCDGDASDAGLVTWWGADGPVDLSDTFTGTIELDGDGTLGIGEGTWDVKLVTAEGATTTIAGHGDVTLSAPDDRVLRAKGTTTASGLTLDAYDVLVDVDSEATFTDVDFGATELWAYQGTDITVTRGTFTGARAIAGSTVGGLDETDRTLTLTESTIDVSDKVLDQIQVVTITDTAITSTTTGLAFTTFTDLTVDGATLDMAGTVFAVGSAGWGPADLTVRDTSIRTDNTVFATNVADTTILLEDVDVTDATRLGNASGADLTLRRVTVSDLSGQDGARISAVLGLTDTAAVLDTVTFTGPGALFLQSSGGADLSITDSHFEQATFHAMQLSGQTGAVDLVRTEFWDNTNLGSGGDGAALEVNAASTGALTITDCDFARNESADRGGAINSNAPDMTLSGNTFTDNTAGSLGGAVFAFSEVTSSGDTFTGNSGSGGGGIFMQRGGTMADVTATGNSVTSNGGAIASGAALTLTGTWDLGSGADDNTPHDIFLGGQSRTVSLESGSGTLTCGVTTTDCAP